MLYFVALDFETTGFSPAKGDRIVEIGAVKFDIDGNLLGTFSELANPGRSIPFYASQIHGITDRDVAHCDSAAKVWNRFHAWAGKYAALVAHNADFEQRFICNLYNGAMPTIEFIDTLTFARSMYCGLPNHKLGTVCSHIGYQIQNAHRALPDARATAHLLADMIRRDPSVVSKFFKPATTVPTPAAPTVVPTPKPTTSKPVPETTHKAPTVDSLFADLPAQWGYMTQLLGFKDAPDFAALQKTMPDGYGVQADRWATWSRSQKNTYVARVIDKLRELQNRPLISAPGSVVIGVSSGRKTEASGESKSAPIRNSTGIGSTWSVLTRGEERDLIATDGTSRRQEEEYGRELKEAELRKQHTETKDRPLRAITRRVLEDGRVFRGYFSEDSLTGKGVCTWPDGRVYEGDFVDGKMDGEGRHTWPGGNACEGDFVNDGMTGLGTYIWPSGNAETRDLFCGPITELGVYIYLDGRVYEGTFENGELSGWGSLTWPDGRVYDGEFRDGVACGEGRYSWPDKTLCESDSFDDCFSGRREWSDGRIYEGDFDFESGQFDGDGRYEWPNGDVYQGQFVSGQRTGQGSYVWSNGTTYEGDFVNGKLTGDGLHVHRAPSKHFGSVDTPGDLPSEPRPRQEPTTEPRPAIPVVNETAHSERADEILVEIAARQREADTRVRIAAEEQRRTQELERQASRQQAENDGRIRQRQQEITDRYDALLKDRFPFTVGGAAWLWFMLVLYPVWAVGEVLFQTKGGFLGAAFFLSLGITPLVLWRARKKRRKSRKYVAIIAKRDAEMREVS